MSDVQAGDRVIVTDRGTDLGRWAGCPATVVEVLDDGWLVVPDRGTPGRREILVDGRWRPQAHWVSDVIADPAAAHTTVPREWRARAEWL
ncbi:hypothetical protein [Nonomuraea sp. NEAU-A123]|uniref:hypothetical protein n=1 Tax=Nonomuraea sp. NEAU-A123 TaxID=2839649 RepID=UPI001BE42299|nr:hypothetical protein [Nonomuraea sp. NEAU-A123]MBT2226229.1 hypothetical protein [Nonomuraea sp. NEAU-A123]